MKQVYLFVAILFALGCNKDAAVNSRSSGNGGSLARFTVVGNYLYIADHNNIKTYDISDLDSLRLKGVTPVGFGVETIFPYDDKLFIGSRDGMFIYSIEDPREPKKLGQALHTRSCDPVVANNKYSYVTLRSGSACGPATAGLYIYDIQDIQKPVQVSLLKLDNPYGLGLKDSVVFVCRDAGLDVVNVKNPSLPKITHTIADAAYRDVIVYDDLLICYVTDGLLLYDIADLNNIVRLDDIEYIK